MNSRRQVGLQEYWRSLAPWFRASGLLMSAWILGVGLTSPCTDDGEWLCGSAFGLWILYPGLLFGPAVLAAIWVWRPLERSGTVAAAAMLVGLAITYHIAKAAPCPKGAECLEDAAFIVAFFGSIFYTMYAGVTWLVLWLIGRKLERF
jgi:hypothetical protein